MKFGGVLLNGNHINSHIRSSRPGVFCKKGVLRNFTKFTGKHLWQSLVFNEVSGLRPTTLLKKRLWHKCFLVNFVKFLTKPFFYRIPLVAASVTFSCYIQIGHIVKNFVGITEQTLSIITPISSPIWQDTLLSSQILSNIEEIKKKETCWGAQAIFFFWKNTILGNFFLKAYCLQHKFAFLKMENFDQLFHFCRFWALEGRQVYLFIFLDNFPLFYFCLNDYFGCWEKRWVSCLQIPIQSQK